MAAQPPGELTVARDVADRLGLPRRFLEQQFTAMQKHGLLFSQKGQGGGSALALPPSQITVGDVVRAVQDIVLDVPHISGSVVSEVWAEAAEELAAVLDRTTLADLVERQERLELLERPVRAQVSHRSPVPVCVPVRPSC